MYLSGLLIVYSGAIIKQLTIISPLRVHALLHLPFFGANNGVEKPHQVASNQKAGTFLAQLVAELARRGSDSPHLCFGGDTSVSPLLYPPAPLNTA